MFEALGEDPKSERLDSGDGLVARLAVRHDPGQVRDLSQPAAVGFSLDLDAEIHGKGNLPSVPAAV